MEKSLLWGDEIPIGKFFERTDVPTLHGAEPVSESRAAGASGQPDSAGSREGFIQELM